MQSNPLKAGHALEGKAVIVTGASGGIGRAIAMYCAREGARVLVADLGPGADGSLKNASSARIVAEEISNSGGSVMPFEGDVRLLETGKAMAECALNAWGRIDGVVCNAAVHSSNLIHRMTEVEFDDVIATSVRGMFGLLRAVLPTMRKQGSGSFVTMVSRSAVGSPTAFSYSAAKAAQVSMTVSAAIALKRHHIRCNGIAPVAVTAMSIEKPRWAETGTSEDIPPMVVYLLSEAAKEVTGQIFTVVGSRISRWALQYEAASMFAPKERWTPQQIAERLPSTIGTVDPETHPYFTSMPWRHDELDLLESIPDDAEILYHPNHPTHPIGMKR